MELLWFIGGLLIVFLPLLCGATLIKQGAELGQAFGVSMMVSLVLGCILQFGIFGVDAHIGVSALILPLYVGLNFLAMLLLVGITGRSTEEDPQEEPVLDHAES